MFDMGLGMMGAAAGAGDSIAQIFDQRLKAAQLGQQDALTRLKIQEVADARAETIKQRDQMATDRATQLKQQEQDRADQRAQHAFPLIPLNTPVSPGTVQSMTQAGIPPEAFQPTPDPAPQPPASIASPDQPPDATLPGTIANSPSPAMRTVQRTPSPQEAEQARRQAATQGLMAILPPGADGERDRAILNYKEATGQNAPASFDPAPKAPPREPVPHFVAQDRIIDGKPIAGVMNTLTGAWQAHPEQGSLHAPAGDRKNPQIERQQKLAEFASGDVTAVLDQIDAADKAGLLGPGSGRIYGQFLAGTVGSTGDPAADERLGGLKAAIKNLNTSYPMAISGNARGGGGALDRLQSVLNSDKFSADLMRGALHEISGALARRTAAPAAAAGTGKRIRYDMQGNRLPD